MSLKIPPFTGIAGWKNVLIRECGEKLVSLNSLSPNLVVVEPEYYNTGIL